MGGSCIAISSAAAYSFSSPLLTSLIMCNGHHSQPARFHLLFECFLCPNHKSKTKSSKQCFWPLVAEGLMAKGNSCLDAKTSELRRFASGTGWRGDECRTSLHT